MKRILNVVVFLACAALVFVGASALAGCSTVKGLGEDMDDVLPASKASVTELREHVDSQDAAIRADGIAVRDEGRKAYEGAIAAGKTEAEAILAAYDAEHGVATARAEAAGTVAVEAKDAAREGGVDWEELVLGLLGAVVTSVTGVNLWRNKTRKKAIASVAAPATAGTASRAASVSTTVPT
jgi:predicted small secreted protein